MSGAAGGPARVWGAARGPPQHGDTPSTVTPPQHNKPPVPIKHRRSVASLCSVNWLTLIHGNSSGVALNFHVCFSSFGKITQNEWCLKKYCRLKRPL